jgi:UDP-N-acetylmuramoyl-L-alanyl-D-glutamate--2,6-diaminopimelate ligase
LNFQKVKNIGHFLNALRSALICRYPGRYLTVIGITGTDGKTTTCHLINHILRQSGKLTALITTTEAEINGRNIDTGLHVTTPSPNKIQKIMKKAVNQKIKYLIIEATSHGLDQHRLFGCNFSVGVLTNITPEHLDYHKSMKNYKKAKAKLFKKVNLAILNKDDDNYKYFKNKTNPKAKVVTYSLAKPARFKIVKKELTAKVIKFLLQSGRKKAKFETKLIGKYNLSNISAAVATTRKLDVSWEKIKKAIASFPGVIGRMEAVDLGQPFNIIIDFAHTPNALKQALTTLKTIKKGGKIIAVFGCAGERDFKKRPEMGQITTKLADLTIFTAEDPRHEDVNVIIDQMVSGTVNENYLREPDRQKAINLAISKAQPGDTVVLFGKGHEKSMCFGNEEQPWSEHEAVKKALQ